MIVETNFAKRVMKSKISLDEDGGHVFGQVLIMTHIQNVKRIALLVQNMWKPTCLK